LIFQNGNFLIKNQSDDFELRIRTHRSSNWIAKILASPTDSGNKILVADTHEIADYNKKHPNQPLMILDERIIKYSDWMVTEGVFNKFLFPLYSEMSMKLRENGLLDRIIAKHFDPRDVRPPPLESDPVVLDFDRVGVAFKISGAFLSLAFIIFMKEITFKKMKQLLLRKILFYFLNRYF